MLENKSAVYRTKIRKEKKKEKKKKKHAKSKPKSLYRINIDANKDYEPTVNVLLV